jgi:alpha-mannosidase
MISRRSLLQACVALSGARSLTTWSQLLRSGSSGTEQQIRQRLGIPAWPKYVLIMDQAAHMDWDWNFTFPEYFSGTYSNGDPAPLSDTGVDKLLTDALALLGKNGQTDTTPYYYSLCETGYLQEFVNKNGTEVISQLKAARNFLRIVGGGITSPDCLVCSGEGFLRNYLIGKLWLASVFPELLPLKHCWIPDDFGQDPELPVAVKALGMTSIGFSRLPGITPGNPDSGISDTSLAEVMLSGNVDFRWTASDNASTVLTHWMPGGKSAGQGYYQGHHGGGTNLTAGAVTAIQNFLAYYDKKFTDFTPPLSGAPTPYYYMPLDEDFMDPLSAIRTYVNSWNSSNNGSEIYAVEASYDDFVSLLLASRVKLNSMAYNGTAYWMGYYASRPDLKILHYATTRSLLAAEVFGLLAFGNSHQANPPYWETVSSGWNDFAPSTHHDYITGTAADLVYMPEQIPRLQLAYNQAQSASEIALGSLAASVCGNDPEKVLIANPAGVPFDGLVELPKQASKVSATLTPANCVVIESSLNPVQKTYEGGLIFKAQAPSMGYSIGTLSQLTAISGSSVTISPANRGATAYTLRNEFMDVVISAESNWGITSIKDALGNSLLQEGVTGNDLTFYTDQGNIFQFANEIPDASNTFVPASVSVQTAGTGLGASVLEHGPLRVRVKTDVSITITGSGLPPQIYTREYRLLAGEPFLRMATTGMAPSGYSIMTAFALAQKVDSIAYGTPCHWTSAQPHEFTAIGPPIFRPTHHFLIPQAQGQALAAIYHPEVPAWGIDQNGVLLGCLFRNTPGIQRGANGTDSSTNTLHYALRVPEGLPTPASRHVLREALEYAMPAVARFPEGSGSNGQASGLDTNRRFIARVSPPGVIQAAKPGDVVPGTLILRIYQPTNRPQTLTVTLGAGRPSAVIPVTALEDPITGDASPRIQITETGFQTHVTTALNTVQVSFPM